MVLYPACVQYGVPERLISDGVGAYTSNAFEAICARLSIDHRTIASREGESWKNLMETHFNIQRRLYDYQFSFAKTPMEFERQHEAFIQLYNTTAPQGLLKEGFRPPIPLQVLADAKGRVYTAEDLRRKFIHYLFLRTTNIHGCVTLHHYHFYVEAGLPQQSVLLWLAGETLRAECESIVLAEYRCRYDWQDRQVKDIREGVLYQMRFTSSQGTLIPLTPQDHWVVYRPTPPRRRGPKRAPVQQVLLFVVVPGG